MAAMPATPLLFCAPAALAAPSEQAEQSNGSRVFHGVGVVVAVESDGSVTIDHQAIPDLMDAMVMQFRVATPALLDGIRKGDHVSFDLDGRTYTILRLSRIAAGGPKG
jgi:Cu/Ag efflux protein CusF